MWTKYDGRELVEGAKIRLSGREGRIVKIEKSLSGEIEPGSINELHYHSLIEWLDQTHSSCELLKFPFLEIWIETPKISKEAAEELKKEIARLMTIHGLYGQGVRSFSLKELKEKIDSMTE